MKMLLPLLCGVTLILGLAGIAKAIPIDFTDVRYPTASEPGNMLVFGFCLIGLAASGRNLALADKKMLERRKDKRFQVRDNAFVALEALSWPHSTTKVGQITDISMGGLAFRYHASEERTNGSFELGIFLAHNSFHLRKIPFETIWDVETKGVRSSFITMRRSGVRFGEMTHDQISGLEYFIRNHTIGH